jgi:hypothetical protein
LLPERGARRFSGVVDFSLRKSESMIPFKMAGGFEPPARKATEKRLFCPRGSAQPFEKAQFRQGKTKEFRPFPGQIRLGLGPALVGFEKFGLGLDRHNNT